MRPTKFEPGTMLLVEWLDIVSDASWQSEQKRNKEHPVDVKTVGFFLRTYRYNGHYCMKLAHSISAEGDSDTTEIPFGCIKNIKRLKVQNG